MKYSDPTICRFINAISPAFNVFSLAFCCGDRSGKCQQLLVLANIVSARYLKLQHIMYCENNLIGEADKELTLPDLACHIIGLNNVKPGKILLIYGTG